jgi:hypothetical protein
MPALWSVDEAIPAGCVFDCAAPAAIVVEKTGDLIREGPYQALPVFWHGDGPASKAGPDISQSKLLPNSKPPLLACVQNLAGETLSGSVVIKVKLHLHSPLLAGPSANRPPQVHYRAICAELLPPSA